MEIAESKPMPSYLVAFVVGPFDVIDAGTAGRAGTPLRFIVPKGRGADTAYAAAVTPKIVGALEDYFGMPYPFGKLDVAVVPRYWGTMEHPGIVALGQPLTLITANDSSLARQQRYANIAAHELAHYWFGDYVTAAWWDDTWLNEALGTWMDATVTDRVEPGWGFSLERIARAANGMKDDALTSAKKIRQPVESKSDIESSFDSAITYYKGQSVLSMFEAWLTPPRFQHVVRTYVAGHAWKNATAEDFFAALDAEQPGAGNALKTFVDQPGLPSIAFETQCSGGSGADGANATSVTIAVHQHRYAPLGETASAGTWKIPVCVRIPKQKGEADRACTLLSSENGTIPIDRRTCPSWVIGNADGVGYYETAYTQAQLRAAWSRSSGATAAERLALLHDAAAMVASGNLPLGDALAMARNTVGSKERQLVAAGLSIIALAPGSAMTDAEAARSASFERKVYGPRAARLGLARRSDDDLDAQLVRPELVEVVAIGGRDAALRDRAHALAFAWLKDERAIPGELVDAVLDSAAKSNDEKLFAALLEKAKAEPDNFKRSRLLGALGSFTDPALVAQADALLTGKVFDVRDAFVILSSQFADRATLQAAWDFVKASFDAVSARMRDDEVLFEYLRVVRHFCDETHQRDVAQFFAPRASRFDGGPRALATAVEAIGRCSATFRKNQPSLDAFLAGY
ncbi:MAG: M1 family metallopeptidase [Polyangiaceae bacterium]